MAADMIVLYLLVDEFLEEEESDEETADSSLYIHLMMGKQRMDIPKVAGFVDLIMHHFSPSDFKRDFRITFGTYQTLLNEVTPVIKYLDRPNGRSPLSPNEQLLIFLWYVANQDCMREISRLFGIAKSTVYRCIRRVSSAISSQVSKFIYWPDTVEQDEISRRIEDLSKIPNVVGFIDGTQIRLSCVPNGDTDYTNRKKIPSLQLQLVVSDSMLIQDAFVGWPGSVHDALVYRSSPIYHALLYGNILGHNKYIIGDGRAIGHLKGRFRRLRDLNCMNVKDACQIIMSTCVLHNICVPSDEDLSEYLENHAPVPNVNNYPPIYRDNPNGVQKRNQIVQFLSRLV